MKYILKEQANNGNNSYAVYEALEEALRALSNRRTMALEQGARIALLAGGNPESVIKFRADYLNGRSYEAWIEVKKGR